MKNSFFKCVLAGLLTCMLPMIMLSGCGNSNNHEIIVHTPNEKSASESKVKLTFFGYKADAINLTAIEQALQSFMAENNDIDIAYEGIKGFDYWTAFDKRDAANVLDDVFMMHHDHVISMSAENKLADLSDLSGLENFADETKEQFTNADGSVYFLPTQVSTYNLYINYDLLSSHGVNVPTNWDEFQQACDYFVSEGIVPIVANNRNSLSTLILSKGLYDVYQKPNEDIEAELQRFNEEPALLAETLVPGVQQVADMLQRGWFDRAETLATEQTSDDLELFLKGDRPFMISGGWASPRVASKNPSFKYGVHPYPILDDGTVLSLQMDTCISVNANSPHLKEVKRFVEHLIDPDVLWAYCDSQASYSPLKEDTRLPSDQTLLPSTDNLRNRRVALRAEYRLNLPIESALLSCSTALLSGSTAEEAQEILVQELQK